MNNKIISELKRGFILFSMMYAVTTLLSSSIQLSQGQPTDTNFHILNRAAVVFIAVITIRLFDTIKFKSQVLSYFVPYAISMSLVFFYVWLTGFIEPLHPDAYRDIFLNFTAVAIGVMTVIYVKDKWQASKNKEKGHTLPL